MSKQVSYTEENIKSLDWKDHIRTRPGMYIGKLGDGSYSDDGSYILLKEIIDNSIDEFVMGCGKKIEIKTDQFEIFVRDYGRGIPLGKLVDVVSKMNTGGKYDSRAFKKSVGLNGVGTKAVNALSSSFKVESVRDGRSKSASFRCGVLVDEIDDEKSVKRNGTEINFTPDNLIFKNYKFKDEHIERMLKHYAFLNPGLNIFYNGKTFFSQNGLRDLLEDQSNINDFLYPIIHLKGDDIEVALTHSRIQYSEEYHSFVNGQNTIQGGTHLSAFREGYVKTIREFFGKNYESSDIRKSIVSSISIKVMEPVFESQTKTKLGSTEMGDGLPSVRSYIIDFLGTHLDNFLHKNNEIADSIQKKYCKRKGKKRAIRNQKNSKRKSQKSEFA